MSWILRHRESEASASEAENLVRLGEHRLAREAYADAALAALDPSKERTRAITVVSAAALFWKAGNREKAVEIARGHMDRDDLPAFARRQLAQIVEAASGDA